MIEAHYYREVSGIQKVDNEEKTTILKEESGNMSIKVKGLLGDEKATVSKHHNRKIGLKWGAGSAGASCTVTLTCDQHSKTIKKAGEAASKLALSMIQEDMEIAVSWLQELVEVNKNV
jgi:hypothetical protein